MSELHVQLASHESAAAQARDHARGWCDRNTISQSARETTLLLLSELVTNAVTHSGATAGQPIDVRARIEEGEILRVEVTDRGEGFDVADVDTTTPHGGFGLYLVADAATRWGVDRGGATTVWFELWAPIR